MSGEPDDWGRVWTWPGNTAFFNERFYATASAAGLSYTCEIDGPFCGLDAVGSQSWEELESSGPPGRVMMCAETRLVAFACKGRGFCPSCLGRKMSQTAANLVDYVARALIGRISAWGRAGFTASCGDTCRPARRARARGRRT